MENKSLLNKLESINDSSEIGKVVKCTLSSLICEIFFVKSRNNLSIKNGATGAANFEIVIRQVCKVW